MNGRLKEVNERFKSQGLSEEEIKKREADTVKELTPIIEREVRAYLIFDKIAQLENIQLNEKESLPAKVIEFLLKEAKWEEAK